MRLRRISDFFAIAARCIPLFTLGVVLLVAIYKPWIDYPPSNETKYWNCVCKSHHHIACLDPPPQDQPATLFSVLNLNSSAWQFHPPQCGPDLPVSDTFQTTLSFLARYNIINAWSEVTVRHPFESDFRDMAFTVVFTLMDDERRYKYAKELVPKLESGWSDWKGFCRYAEYERPSCAWP